MIREVADKIDHFYALNGALPDPRNSAFVIHDEHTLIAQRVTAIALGYEDLNDHQNLRAAPAL